MKSLRQNTGAPSLGEGIGEVVTAILPELAQDGETAMGAAQVCPVPAAFEPAPPNPSVKRLAWRPQAESNQEWFRAWTAVSDLLTWSAQLRSEWTIVIFPSGAIT